MLVKIAQVCKLAQDCFGVNVKKLKESTNLGSKTTEV